MTRIAKFITLGLLPLWLPLTLGLLLIGTRSGSQWLVAVVQQLSDGRIQVDTVDGRFLDEFALSGVRLRLQDQISRIGRVSVRWQPATLRHGLLHLERVQIDEADLQLAQSSATQDDTATGFDPGALPLQLRLDSLELKSVRIQAAGRQPIELDHLSAGLVLEDGRLQLQTLRLSTPDGSLQAQAEAALTAPYALQADMDWRWRFAATGELTGRLRLRGDSRKLSLNHEGLGALPLNLELELDSPLQHPAWSGRLYWPAFVPPQELGAAGLKLSAGQLQSRGSLEDYRLELSLAHAGAGLPPLHWALQGRGDRNHLTLDALELELPQGGIQGQGRLDWLPALAARLQLSSAGLDLRGLAGELPPALAADLDLKVHREGEAWILERVALHLPQAPARLGLTGRVDLSAPAAPAVAGRLEWSGLRWPLSGDARIGSPEGHLTLTGTLDAYRGELQAALISALPTAAQLSLTATGDRSGVRLEPARAEWLGGSLALSGDLHWAPSPGADLSLTARDLDPALLVPDWPPHTPLSADGRLGYDGRRVSVETLQLRTGPAARLDLSGWVEPAETPLDSTLSLQLGWSDLAWPVQGGPVLAASAAGTLQVSGTPRDYRVKGGFALAGSDLPAGAWTVQAQGGPSTLALEDLHGAILDGSLTLTGELAWAPATRWDLSLSTADLNPAGLLPALPGRLDLNSRIQGRLDDRGALHLQWDLERLRGRLLDRPLTMQGRLAVTGDSYQASGLELSSGRNRVQVDGGMSAGQLDVRWRLEAPEPAVLLPDAGGELQGQGRVAGSLQAPSLSAELHGAGLQTAGLVLQQVQAKFDATLATQGPLQLRFQAKGLTRDAAPVLEQATLSADGRLERHTLKLDLRAPPDRLQAEWQGGVALAERAWQGSLQALGLESPGLGNWSLTEPAALSLGQEHLELAETCLRLAGGDGRLCANASRRAGQGAQIAASLRELDLKRLLPALGATLSGELYGSLGADGALRAEAKARLSEGVIPIAVGGREQTLTHRGGSLDAVVDATGLQARILIEPLEQGRVSAELALPDLNRWPLAPEPAVEGRLRARIPDLTPLQAFLPQLSNTHGTLDADVKIAGRLPMPAIQGAMELQQGAADLDQLGLKLRRLGLRLSTDPDSPERWLLNGGVESAGGELRLQGAGRIDASEAQVRISGHDFAVMDTPSARVRLAPDLQLAWDGERLKVRGRILLPLAEITPQLELASRLGTATETGEKSPDRVVKASPDVVMLDPQGKPAAAGTPAAAGLPLDSEVSIALGDKVRVDAAGFRSRIAGELTLVNPPGRPDPIPLARGRLALEEGTYRSFGQDLEIDPNSQLIFNGGPVTEPELQLRATRWIRNDDQVNAVGVHLSGALDAPRVDVFSDPQLDEQTILSYLVTGKAPDSNEQMLSIGTRLNEDLYVGYGINLLEQTQAFNLRYDIFRWFALEADVGEADKNVSFSYTLER